MIETKSTPSDVTEDRTSATGSNVAPRSIGRQFSPRENNKGTLGNKEKNLPRRKWLVIYLNSSLGSKKHAAQMCVIQLQTKGSFLNWKGTIGEKSFLFLIYFLFLIHFLICILVGI